MKLIGWSHSDHAVVEMTPLEWLNIVRGSKVERFDKLGAAVKDYRRHKKLSLRQLGKLCRISASTISRIERGEQPTLAHAVTLSKEIRK